MYFLSWYTLSGCYKSNTGKCVLWIVFNLMQMTICIPFSIAIFRVTARCYFPHYSAYCTRMRQRNRSLDPLQQRFQDLCVKEIVSYSQFIHSIWKKFVSRQRWQRGDKTHFRCGKKRYLYKPAFLLLSCDSWATFLTSDVFPHLLGEISTVFTPCAKLRSKR